MYIHKDILVGSNVEYFWSKKNKEPITEHDNIVLHYSGGSTALATVKYLANEKTQVSAHLVIARDGKIYQLVDFTTQSWHTSRSQLLGNTGLNACSIGIELENAGRVMERNNRYYAWFGKRIPDDQVIRLVNPQTGFHAWWQPFTEIQLSTLREVCKKLLEYYNFRRIVGHSEISLIGRSDPGPAFPMDELKKLIYR